MKDKLQYMPLGDFDIILLGINKIIDPKIKPKIDRKIRNNIMYIIEETVYSLPLNNNVDWAQILNKK